MQSLAPRRCGPRVRRGLRPRPSPRVLGDARRADSASTLRVDGGSAGDRARTPAAIHPALRRPPRARRTSRPRLWSLPRSIAPPDPPIQSHPRLPSPRARPPPRHARRGRKRSPRPRRWGAAKPRSVSVPRAQASAGQPRLVMASRLVVAPRRVLTRRSVLARRRMEAPRWRSAWDPAQPLFARSRQGVDARARGSGPAHSPPAPDRAAQCAKIRSTGFSSTPASIARTRQGPRAMLIEDRRSRRCGGRRESPSSRRTPRS